MLYNIARCTNLTNTILTWVWRVNTICRFDKAATLQQLTRVAEPTLYHLTHSRWLFNPFIYVLNRGKSKIKLHKHFDRTNSMNLPYNKIIFNNNNQLTIKASNTFTRHPCPYTAEIVFICTYYMYCWFGMS